MKKTLCSAALFGSLLWSAIGAPALPDKFVWVFGWGLGTDADAQAICNLITNSSKAGLNGAVASLGFDTLCRQGPDYFRRLRQVRKACESSRVELIPAVFSIGYGGGALSHDRNLAEGLLVSNATFVVRGNRAEFVPGQAEFVRNGGFEDFTGNKAAGYAFHDQPGEITFIDTEVKHSGRASMRLSNFGANPHGNARVMQPLKVSPNRCYRASLRVRSEGLNPVGAFRATVLAGERNLAPREFHVKSDNEWQRISFLFNSMDFAQVSLYIGLWGGKSGTVWLDDIAVEEVGPVNVLNRPGTPVFVASADGKLRFVEGKDYTPLRDPNLQPYLDDKPALSLDIPAGSAITNGQQLLVSWYHSMLIHDSQVTVCMAEPAIYDIFDHEMKLLAENVDASRVLLNTDEVRMGGMCAACAGRDMAQLIGECVTRQVRIVHKYMPSAKVYIWSDMFDPHHNARPSYYLVRGDYTGSWKHLPKDVVVVVWGGEPREASASFFAQQGFETLYACYYDADHLNDVRAWLDLARKTPGARGLMYTPWLRKYDLLPAFGELLRQPNR